MLAELRPTTLNEWRKRLKDLSKSPFVGPRPQTPDDHGMLVGRNDVLKSIERKVQDVAVLVIDGESGSGKTSLLQNGLVARLEKRGFAALVCREWVGIAEGENVDTYLHGRLIAHTMNSNHQLEPVELSGKASSEDTGFFVSPLARHLEEKFDGLAVVILDQFEELLRHHLSDATRLVEWLHEVVREEYQVRFIISLRSDAMNLLEPLLKGFRPFSLDRAPVEPLGEEWVPDVIDRRSNDPSLPSVVVSDEVKNTITDAWKVGRQDLLGLQALLASLYFQARDDMRLDPSSENRSAESSSDSKVTIDEHVLDEVVGGDRRLFEKGIEAHIEFAIRRAERATVEVGIDAYLRYGARELVSRTTPYLWSSGFKVSAAEAELVENILGPELRLLASVGDRRPVDGGQSVPKAGELASQMLSVDDLLNFQPDCNEDQVSSRNHATAGPLLYHHSERAVIEEARRAAFAITWLQTTEIVRRSAEGRIELVHDGSGFGLERWAKLNSRGLDYEAHRLTAARGEALDLGIIDGSRSVQSDEAEDEHGWVLGGGTAVRLLPNLNWRDCRIKADLSNLVFLNCDFSGARFEECKLKGVTFVNCLLDDANFESCQVMGKTAITPEERPNSPGRVRIAPSFRFDVDPALVDAFRPYSRQVAELEPGSGSLFSELAGGPAVPGDVPPSLDKLVQLVDPLIAKGGIAFVGGRVSFLTLHSCGDVTGEQGEIDFHYVGGGGLDIVEPLHLAVRLHDCVVRGVSITRDQQDENSGMCKASGGVQFSVSESILVSVYLSGGLHGAAKFERSMLWGVINAGDATASREAVEVSFDECRYQWVVNVHSIERSVEDSVSNEDQPPYFEKLPDGVSRFKARDVEALAVPLDFMDFRREPEMRERRQRVARAAERD